MTNKAAYPGLVEAVIARYVNKARAQASIDNDMHVTHPRNHPTLGEL